MAIQLVQSARREIDVLEFDEAHGSSSFLPETKLPKPRPARKQVTKGFFEERWGRRARGKVSDIERINLRDEDSVRGLMAFERDTYRWILVNTAVFEST